MIDIKKTNSRGEKCYNGYYLLEGFRELGTVEKIGHSSWIIDAVYDGNHYQESGESMHRLVDNFKNKFHI